MTAHTRTFAGRSRKGCTMVRGDSRKGCTMVRGDIRKGCVVMFRGDSRTLIAVEVIVHIGPGKQISAAKLFQFQFISFLVPSRAHHLLPPEQSVRPPTS